MKKFIPLVCSVLFVSDSNAASTVDYINVEGDTLYFSIDEVKTVASPTCVAVATNNRWAVTLSSQQGQSIYSTLLTAVANQLPVEVVSAGDCKDANGIERAKSVALTTN